MLRGAPALLLLLAACAGGEDTGTLDDTGSASEVVTYEGLYAGQAFTQATLQITPRDDGGETVHGSAWLDYGDLQSIRLQATETVELDADGRVVTWTQDLVHTLGNTELSYHFQVDARTRTATQGLDDHGSTFTWQDPGPVVLYAYPSDPMFGLALPTPVAGYTLARAFALGEDVVLVWPFYGITESFPATDLGLPGCWFWLGDRWCNDADFLPNRYSPSTLNARAEPVTTPVDVPEVSAPAPTVIVTAPDCSVPVGPRQVAFTVDSTGSVTLAGRLLLPEGGGPYPTVQINAGTGGSTRTGQVGRMPLWDCVAHDLLAQGIAVATYDDRGLGSSGGVPGQPYAARTDDVDLVAAWVRAQSQVSSLYLLGHSEGVSHVSEAVGTGTAARGLILVSGIAGHGDDAWIEQSQVYMESLGFPQDEVDEVIAARQDLVSQVRAGTYPAADLGPFSVDDFWAEFFDIDGLALIDATTQPVLVVQGGADWQVPSHNGTDFQAHLTSEGRAVTLDAWPSLGHLLQPAVGPAPIGLEYFLPWGWDAAVTEGIADWVLLQEDTVSR